MNVVSSSNHRECNPWLLFMYCTISTTLHIDVKQIALEKCTKISVFHLSSLLACNYGTECIVLLSSDLKGFVDDMVPVVDERFGVFFTYLFTVELSSAIEFYIHSVRHTCMFGPLHILEKKDFSFTCRVVFMSWNSEEWHGVTGECMIQWKVIFWSGPHTTWTLKQTILQQLSCNGAVKCLF